MDFWDWLQTAIILGPTLLALGINFEKIRQIERRLDGNGNSVPGRCRVHGERLDSYDRRLTAIEAAEK